jgi:AraC family transcriptional regulator
MTLLTTTRASVTQIAYAVGFSNLSHFRRVFRGHTGVLPGAVRNTASFDPPKRPGRCDHRPHRPHHCPGGAP